MAIQRQREGKRRLWREMFGKHFITTLLLQLSYLQSNNRGLGSAGQYFIRNRAGERGELGKVGGGGAISVTAWRGAEPQRTEWHFRLPKSIPSQNILTALRLLPFL